MNKFLAVSAILLACSLNINGHPFPQNIGVGLPGNTEMGMNVNMGQGFDNGNGPNVAVDMGQQQMNQNSNAQMQNPNMASMQQQTAVYQSTPVMSGMSLNTNGQQMAVANGQGMNMNMQTQNVATQAQGSIPNMGGSSNFGQQVHPPPSAVVLPGPPSDY